MLITFTVDRICSFLFYSFVSFVYSNFTLLLLPCCVCSSLRSVFCVCGNRAKFHRDCALKAPPSCGLSDEIVDQILSSISKDNGQQFHSCFLFELCLCRTSGESNLAKAALNDPTQWSSPMSSSPCGFIRRVRYRLTDRQTRHIGNNSLNLMHLVQPISTSLKLSFGWMLSQLLVRLNG